jgi:hypothetical protein
MQAALDPSGRGIRLETLTIRTPGLRGTVTTVPSPSRNALRGAGATSEFDRVLRRSGMRTTHLISLDLVAETEGRHRRDRGEGAIVGPSIILDVPGPVAGWEQVVLAVDEHGVVTWHFGQDNGAGGPVARGGLGPTRHYNLAHHQFVPPTTPDGRATTRSLVGNIGKRIVKVIAFPVGKYIGERARDLIRDWENRNRPNGIRTYLPAERDKAIPYFPPQAAVWKELAKGRSLLLIHGTFSRCHSGLGAIPDQVLSGLHELYGGRVFAYDHHTISDSPTDNARWFLDQIPDDVKLELDIICHSRGGLVARTLAESGLALETEGKVTVRRVALVAVPSEGTVLADVENWNRLIDTVSSLINLASGPGFGDVLETILAFVRQIVVAGSSELVGLSCMVPGGSFLEALNAQARGNLVYLGITSNFEPHNADLTALIKDEALDLLHGAANDTLVRTDSALGSPREVAPFQGVDAEIILDGPNSVVHSAYFGQASLMTELADWLAAGV